MWQTGTGEAIRLDGSRKYLRLTPCAIVDHVVQDVACNPNTAVPPKEDYVGVGARVWDIEFFRAVSTFCGQSTVLRICVEPFSQYSTKKARILQFLVNISSPKPGAYDTRTSIISYVHCVFFPGSVQFSLCLGLINLFYAIFVPRFLSRSFDLGWRPQ